MTPDHWSPLAIEEYRALRATIRERGTARWIVIAVTFVAWPAAVFSSFAMAVPPIAALFSLLLLAGSFETVFGLHIGVERVGRYIQVRYEAGEAGPPRWEHEAMAMGGHPQLATGSDPLCIGLFGLAALLNVGAGLIGATDLDPLWSVGLALPHLLFVLRLVRGRRVAQAQRPIDLAFFQRGEPATRPQKDPTS